MKSLFLRSSLAISTVAFALVGLSSVGAASSGAAAQGASPGYWLMTGYGTSYGFNSSSYDTQNASLFCADPGGSKPMPTCTGVSTYAGGSGYNISVSLPLSGPSNGTYIGQLSSGSDGTGGAIPPGGCSSAAVRSNAPVVDVASAPVGAWLVASDGGVFGLCGAGFYGSMGGKPLNKPIVGIAATPDGGGYWEVASDGGIFSFGDAAFYGSMGGKPLNQPIVGMAATPSGKGYWLVASDGGIFSFGDATFSGSMGGTKLNSPMVGIAANLDGTGYWTVAADGGVFAFGDAPYLGSAAGTALDSPIVGIASHG